MMFQRPYPPATADVSAALTSAEQLSADDFDRLCAGYGAIVVVERGYPPADVLQMTDREIAQLVARLPAWSRYATEGLQPHRAAVVDFVCDFYGIAARPSVVFGQRTNLGFVLTEELFAAMRWREVEHELDTLEPRRLGAIGILERQRAHHPEVVGILCFARSEQRQDDSGESP